jgi:hypothetical protein
MSGVGKSSALAALRERGFETVDTDVGDWGDGRVWDEDRIAALLDRDRDTTLYLSGTVENQGRFYPRFGAVVLLSAPLEVVLERVATRTTNDYGKRAGEPELIARHVAAVEPPLRATCTHEIDATLPLDAVVAELVRIGASLHR